MPEIPPSPRSNRRGCYLILIVVAVVLAAIAYAGFTGKPQPQGDAIPVM